MVSKNPKDMVLSLMKTKILLMKLSKPCMILCWMVERLLLIMQQNQQTAVVAVVVCVVVVAEVEVVVDFKMEGEVAAAVAVEDMVVVEVDMAVVAITKEGMVDKVVVMDRHLALEDMVNKVVAMVAIKAVDTVETRVVDTATTKAVVTIIKVVAMEASKVADMVVSNPAMEINKAEDIIHNSHLNPQDSMEPAVVEAITTPPLKHLVITNNNPQDKAMVANLQEDKDNHNNMVAKVMATNNNKQPLLPHLTAQAVMDNKHPLLAIVAKVMARVLVVITNNLIQVLTARVVALVATLNSNNNPLMEDLQVLVVMEETPDQVDTEINKKVKRLRYDSVFLCLKTKTMFDV